MKGFSAVFSHQEVHQFTFSGQAVLLADDFQEGDGVVPVNLFICSPVNLPLCSPVHQLICPSVHLFIC